MLTQSDVERERYEARLKGLRDLSSARKEGLDLGILMGEVRLCQRMLQQAQTPLEELKAMSAEDLARLADDLKKLAFPPK